MESHTHPLWLIGLSVGTGLIPIFAGLLTSYTKVSIVFGLLKSAFGAQGIPSGLVVMSLSLATTFHVMAPVFEKTVEQAKGIDYSMFEGSPKIDVLKELVSVAEPWKEFLKLHSGQREVKVLAEHHLYIEEVAKVEDSADSRENKGLELRNEMLPEETAHTDSFSVLVPAFVLTELREAFTMGFVLLLPFLVIDMIIANILVGMGMFMVSPVLISLPVKIFLFIAADGWLLLSRGVLYSYQVG